MNLLRRQQQLSGMVLLCCQVGTLVSAVHFNRAGRGRKDIQKEAAVRIARWYKTTLIRRKHQQLTHLIASVSAVNSMPAKHPVSSITMLCCLLSVCMPCHHCSQGTRTKSQYHQLADVPQTVYVGGSITTQCVLINMSQTSSCYHPL